MNRGTVFGLALVAALSSAACGSYASHVEADDAALGRVVVYRNGIAYYERKAEVREGTLKLTVPQDKIDDFLKSLTVRDVVSGKPLPVSFPTQGAAQDGNVDMTVQIDQPGVHEVVLTYITEAPAWKPSYRVVLEDGKVKVQGWAIVDNTSGESWRDVKVGVGSSSALSFRYDLRSVRLVHRETLHTDDHFAVAPPTGGATREEKEEQAVVAAFDATTIPGAPERSPLDDSDEHTGAVTTGAVARPDGPGSPRLRRMEAGGTKRPAPEQPPAEAARQASVKALADRLRASSGNVVIEGYAAPGEADASNAGNDRANWLRNALIQEGVAPARLEAVSRGYVAGQPGGVKVVEEARETREAAADGAPIGESHFESQLPMTVEKGTSALVSILDADADGSVVYLYDAESERGNDRYAFKAVRFKNPTTSTLETGPMTVYGEGRFIGEGLTDPIPPTSTAIVPYALDRQVIVEQDVASGDRIARLLTLQRGILRTEVQHARTTKLKITSILHETTDVFVRHTVRKGWTLTKSPEVYERQGEAHLFKVTLAPGATRTIEIVEATPMVRAIDVRGDEGIELVRVYLEGEGADAKFAEPMKKLLVVYREMADVRQAIGAARERIAEFRFRMEELQQQITSLDGVRSARELMRHLQAKMREVSERVQRGTIDIVNLQEKLMMARVRFQDGVAELSFEAQLSAAKTPAVTPGG